MKYVLITPARNEQAFIGGTLDSVCAQTVLPERWVVVDDGSTDRTVEIVEGYTRRYPWIELVRRPVRTERSFAAKVHAFNAGFERVQSLDFEVIGNLDADLSFEQDYVEFLLGKFSEDPKLGVAGTPFLEDGYDSATDSFEGEKHVAGGCQMFRRACFQDVGGFIPNRAGGVDWIAVTTARMKGWTTRNFPEKRFHHHRMLGTGERSSLAARFSYGQKDYYLGGSPVWQLFRVAYRMAKRPYIIEGMALLCGYGSAALRRVERPVSPELIRFHRREQMEKLQDIFHALLRFKKVDNFHLGARPVRAPEMPSSPRNLALAEQTSRVLARFVNWLEGYGETSLDFQTFYAGRLGGWAKGLYYRRRRLGTVAVAPIIFCEAFVPSARRLFFPPIRFPIADAHYAMGFVFLYQATAESAHLEKARHFLEVLKETRCRDCKEYGWGYAFDWVTLNGTIKKETPLITTTPYAYEAFLAVYQADGRPEWRQILESIARHARWDIKDFPVSAAASSCSYTPFDKGGIINAAAYRAFLLTSAAQMFSNEDYAKTAERNMNFVLENQNSDGSWPYAVDGVRGFVDHFHTCFVMKALAKIHSLTGHKGCLEGLARGVDYYLNNLFTEDGLPRPFSKAPRLIVYKRELYDFAECVNLCLLLRGRFPKMERTLQTVVAGILRDWVKPDGSFRSRQLLLGWDNVPMHRWAQSQMFRSLAFYLREARAPKVTESNKENYVRDLRPA